MSNAVNSGKDRDLSQRPLSFWIGWGLPIVIFLSMNFVRDIIPFNSIILIMAGAFAWMGVGCLINAQRCRRRHCYLAGPVFLIGSLAVLLTGFEFVNLGPDGLIYVTWGTFLIVGLTFIPEWIWGTYGEEKG